MTIDDFIELFAQQFDDTDISELTPECDFKELDEWSSLTVLSVIAMAKTTFNKDITAKEIRECKSVESLFSYLNH